MSRRERIDFGRDPVADGWTIALWSATADLLLCRYVNRTEGEFDQAGRWRRRHLCHALVGRPADQARAAAMAQHFCSVVRLSARTYATGLSAYARRSFEIAFAARLTARLRSALSAARADPLSDHAEAAEANDAAVRALGLERPAIPDSEGISNWDRKAARHGKAAADNISLVLRERFAAAGITKPARAQPQLPF